jgi:hypothetical protein
MNAKEIRAMIHSAIGGDVLSNEGGGFISVMAKKRESNTRIDIPVAFECYSLLEYALNTCDTPATIDDMIDPATCGTSIHTRDDKLVCCIDVAEGALPYVAHWASDRLAHISRSTAQYPGTLCIPFCLLQDHAPTILMPEWCAAFYVRGHREQCIPLLMMQSTQTNPQFENWINVALHRLSSFGLPVDKALEESERFDRTIHATETTPSRAKAS